MNVISLEQVLDYQPLTVAPNTPLLEVISSMNQRLADSCSRGSDKIPSEASLAASMSNSCALVINDRKLVGIFTERDLVRQIATGSAVKEMTVGEVMTRELVVLKTKNFQDIFSLLGLMRSHRIRHLPVEDESEALVGIVTIDTIRRALHPSDLLRFRQVKEAMNTRVIHTAPETSVLQITKFMARELVSCVVIADRQASGDLIPLGIITERDIVQFQILNLDLGQIRAEELMSAPLFLIDSSDSLWRANELMQHHKVRRLVVGEPGKLEGIITQSSILQMLHPWEIYEVMEQLQRQVRKLEVEKHQLLHERNLVLEKQVEERSQILKEQAALLDITTDAILVEELDGAISFWNRGAQRMYGWTREEVLGKQVNEFWFVESIAEWERIEQEVKEKDEWHGELDWTTKEGKKIAVASRWILIRDENGTPKSILVVNTDITEQKQLQAQLFRIQRLESLGTLAGGIAHDLSNILNPILGLAEILPLKLAPVDPKTQEILDIIKDSALRGAELVKQILSFAKGVRGERVLMQIAPLLWEVKKFIQKTLPPSIEFQTEIPSNLWPIRGDATQIHQVLMNLCINAKDAMPEGGILFLRAKNQFLDEHYVRMNLEARVGAFAVITVSDTGTGIPKEIIERIFEPFFTTKSPERGTGLGLSTVVGIVKSHGGFITVDSQLGRGSKFQVYLPAAETPTNLALHKSELPTGKGELILVVDDEAAIREVTKLTLETYNYRVVTAGDGFEAIALCVQRRHEIKFAIVDLTMPSMDGMTTMQILHKIDPRMKMIAVRGLASDSLTTTGQNRQIEAFLTKPYTAEELLLALNRVKSP